MTKTQFELRKCANGPCDVYFYSGTNCPGCMTIGLLMPQEHVADFARIFNVIQGPFATSVTHVHEEDKR